MTVGDWRLYGPHIYQSIHLAYNPRIDTAALMDRYFHDLYGDTAGPLVAQYWRTIDQGFQQMHAHTGSLFALHRVFTPDRLKTLRALLKRAKAATASQELRQKRLELLEGGLRNIEQFMTIRHALHQGDIAEASDIYNNLLKRYDAAEEQGMGVTLPRRYVQRFIGQHIIAIKTAIQRPGIDVLGVLPDQWRLQYAPKHDGLARGYQKNDFDDSQWKVVRTYSDPLNCARL